VGEPGRRLLGGRYELGALLATGGQGQVWRARDTVLSRSVAVKVLRSEFTGDPTFLARFRAEAQHAALVAHRNIATLYDYGELEDGLTGERLAFLVMELVDGESLAELLARERRLDAPRTLALLRQAADALAAAHAAGLVHRDVKPGNVLVAPDGTVKITDFGIAVSASSVPLTNTGQVVGTAHYLSPEQAAGARASAASDVYALGLIGYECLAGRRAFDGESSVQIALAQLRDTPDPLPDDVPEAVRALLSHAMAKDPARRLPDGAALRDAIDDVLAGRPLPPLAPVTSPMPVEGVRRRPPRRTRVLVPLAALAVGALGAGLGVLQLSGEAVLPAAAGTTEAAAPVVLTAADHLGRPVDEVEAELARLGLGVERIADPAAAAAAGTVTGIGPTGALAPGTVVTLAYAVGRPEPEPEPAPPAAGPTVTDVATGPAAGAAPPAPPAPAPAPDAVVPAGAPDDAEVPPPAQVTGRDGAGAAPPTGPGNSNGNRNGKGNGNGNGKGNAGRGRG
jgi:serine/threonine-protein kinase